MVTAETAAANGGSSPLQLPQDVINFNREHHFRDPRFDSGLLKDVGQLAFLFGVEVLLIDIVDVEIALAGSRTQPTERMWGVTSRPVATPQPRR